jgi:DNA-binding transcriptional ArsR family regulator
MFERNFEVGRSKISYQLGKLKEAGLVHEGRWLRRAPAGVSECAG